jgi:hypothetical protein
MQQELFELIQEGFNMKKLLLIMTLLTSLSSYALSFEQCENEYDGNEAVSDDYMSCLNRNFVKIRMHFDLSSSEFKMCYNRDYSVVDIRYIDCINDNIAKSAQLFKVKLSYCPNYSTEQLTGSFVGCLNYRFFKIEESLTQ